MDSGAFGFVNFLGIDIYTKGLSDISYICDDLLRIRDVCETAIS